MYPLRKDKAKPMVKRASEIGLLGACVWGSFELRQAIAKTPKHRFPANKELRGVSSLIHEALSPAVE
jgi:hypothetical protein